MRKGFFVFAVVIMAAQISVRADEGMWLVNLIEQVNMDEMTALGIEMTADQIYSINHASLKDAVGALDRGSCTAELVSPDGLLLTNHHCGFDEIQHHSSVEHDYLKNGFWAMTRDEELPNEGKTITFLVRVEEVTDQIVPELENTLNEEERSSRIRMLSGALTSAATEGTNYEARVRSMFNGNRFFLFVTETYMDVRLVGAPPESIGKFGGDTDNWMWPRHTGDFSMFRVYTGPDGEPAEYSPDNIPLKSKHHLPISLKGYELGDFAMVLGYPGSTDRYMTSWEVQELLDVVHPDRILIRGLKQDLMMQDMNTSERVRIQYAAKYYSSTNYYKYSIGQSRGLRQLNVVGKKQAQEEAFTEWVDENEERKAEYGDALELIHEAVMGRRELVNASQFLAETILRAGNDGGMEAVNFSRRLQMLERVMADAEPDQDEINRVVDWLKVTSADFYRDYNPPTDQKVTEAMIDLLITNLSDEYLPENVLEVKYKFKGNTGKYVEQMFKKSFVTNQERFLAFLENPSLKVLRKDPVYIAGLSASKYMEIRGMMADFDDAFDRGSRLYLKGLMEMYPERDFYSDANSTMRMTYGTVGDYSPRDAVLYLYEATLKGVMEKEDPENFEFIVPAKLKTLYQQKDYGRYGEDGRMMVCFTTNNDITGGNSGSPVINSKGELIGIAFDGNWESMSGDVAFESELQKCINVDIRYVLFIIDKFAGASHLVREMTLVE
ncbi:MAG: S46 family peptidase [Bacteroidales bacterium]